VSELATDGAAVDGAATAASRLATAATTAGVAGSSDLIAGGFGAAGVADSIPGAAASLADTATTIAADALVGAEDVLLGDAAMDVATSSGLGDAVAGVGTVVADVGVGAVSFLPSWLVSGGLVALLGEAVFALIALVVVLQAGASKGAEVVSSVTSAPAEDSSGRTMEATTTAIKFPQEKEVVSQPQANKGQQINAPSSTSSYLDSLDDPKN